MIYRVIAKKTGSYQPGENHFGCTVLYCGTSLEDARIAYLKSEPDDEYRGYGNRYRSTEIEQFESEPEEIDDFVSEAVEME